MSSIITGEHSPTARETRISLTAPALSRNGGEDTMASSPPIRIEDEVITLELTGQREGLEPPFSLDWQLDLALARGTLSDESLASVRRLCGLLDSARSAVVGTSHAGSETTSAALFSCLDSALKAKRAVLDANRKSDALVTLPRSHRVSTNVKTVFPTVLIIVRHGKHGRRVSDTLSSLVHQFHLPIRSDHFLSWTRWEPDLPSALDNERNGNLDIAICTVSNAMELMRKQLMCLEMTRLVLWAEATQLFGSEFRRWTGGLYPSGSYLLASAIGRQKQRPRSVMIGPARQLKSLSIVNSQFLRARGYSIIIGDGERCGRGLSSGGTSTIVSTQEDDEKHVPPSQLAPQQQSSLLALPGELRNRIFEYLLVQGSSFSISWFRPAGGTSKDCRAVCSTFVKDWRHYGAVFDHHTTKWEGMSPSNLLALPQVNKQLALETLPLFYSANTFEFETFGAINVFVRSIGSNAIHLRYIDMHQVIIRSEYIFRHSRPFAAIRNCNLLPSLERLRIDCGRLLQDEDERHDDIVTVDQLLHAMKDYLLYWHDTHKDVHGRSGVLELIEMTTTCRTCAKPLDEEEVPEKSGHSHWCSWCKQVLWCPPTVVCRVDVTQARAEELRKKIKDVLALPGTKAEFNDMLSAECT